MINDKIINQEEELTKIEARAIDAYIEDIYSKKVPEPQPPTKEDLSFWKIAGIEATLFTISGIAIVIYSAIRTGGLFYIMETLLLREFNIPETVQSTFATIVMFAALGGFELYVSADGFSKGKENKSLKRSNIGLYSSLGVIVLAGIFTGLGLLPQLNETFKTIFYIVIAVLTSVAGGLVALFSGENIGFTVQRVEKVREKLIKNHSENYQKWKEAGIKSYQTSRYAIGSKKANDFVEQLKQSKIIESSNNFSEQQEEENYFNHNENYEIVNTSVKYVLSNNSFTIYSNIVDFVKRNGRLPKSKELESISTDKEKTSIALSQYVISYEAYLLKNNLITKDILNRAKKFLEENRNHSFFKEFNEKSLDKRE